jgi:protein-S-isoprenylcysteine O-methyltransferase Ste14
MGQAIFGVGCVFAGVLLPLLAVTLLSPRLRIWPTPGEKSWQSYVFWPLFRGLNVACIAAAWFSKPGFVGMPWSVRVLALGVLVSALALFAYSFRMLGRDNSYGARDGLMTGGIYQWSRNPQNAMLVVVYGALAVAADSGAVSVLCVAMMLVYVMMVFCEEPWLRKAYGDAYEAYCREVPRFFNWRRVFGGRGGVA